MKVGRREPRAIAASAPTATPAAPEADRDDVEGGIAPGCTVHDGLRNLVQLLPRVMRGLRRRPSEPDVFEGVPLGARHGSALALLREHQATVGGLAAALDLNLATVSGLVADLERVGFVERSTDPADRRRTIVRITPGSEDLVDGWREGATAPLARALQQLSAEERTIFIKAMGYLDTELNTTPSVG